MCGRFTLRTPQGVLIDQFAAQLAGPLQLAMRYNIAPTQSIPVVRLHDGQRELTTMRWGLIPSWAKDTKVGFSGINARADTVATKPAFRAAYKKRRCLVLAGGYYEWVTEGKAKLPQLYEIDGGKPFAFAGLWEQWWGADKASDDPLESCTIITTDANELARKVHDRMPVILDPPDYDAWLDPANQDVAYMLDQIPADRMTVRPVSTFVNNARHGGAECIAPPA
jgi:putative SOS response-associated peptidase YedK